MPWRGALPRRQAQRRSDWNRHSRPHESRRATVIRDTSIAVANRFPGVVAVARITSRRRPHGKRADKPAVRYYVLSKYIPAKRLLQIVRSHWASRTACIGSRCSVRRGWQPNRKTMPRRTRDLAKIRTNIIRSHPTEYPCAKNSGAPAGTTLSFSISSATSIALPCGEGQGEG